jgi:hypothetical protein
MTTSSFALLLTVIVALAFLFCWFILMNEHDKQKNRIQTEEFVLRRFAMTTDQKNQEKRADQVEKICRMFQHSQEFKMDYNPNGEFKIYSSKRQSHKPPPPMFVQPIVVPQPQTCVNWTSPTINQQKEETK